MIIKMDRREFDVHDNDLILDNGACYILITQKYYYQWHDVSPTFPKYLFKKMQKEGKIVLSKKKYKSVLGGKLLDLYEFRVDEEGGDKE